MAKMTVDGNTTLSQLQKFTADVGDTSKLRAKYDKATDTYKLYTSSKGNGTGLKEKLFGTVTTRRNNAQAAIAKVIFQTPRVDAFGGQVSALNTAFNNVRAGLTHAGDIRGGEFKTAVADAHLAFVQALLPDGVDVDSNGVVRGAQDITHSHDKGIATPIGSIMQQCVDDRLAGKFKGEMKDIGGTKVMKEYLTDASRMDMTIAGKATRTKASEGTPERAANDIRIATDLKNLCGTHNATKVMSALCHQGTLSAFLTNLTKSDGEAIRLLQPQKSGMHNPCDYTDGNGVSTHFDNVTQYGGADFKVDKYPNGDFKLNVSWDYMFAKVEVNEKQHMIDPSNPKAVLKQNISFEIRVDKAAADQGQFAFSFEQAPLATIEGKIG